MKKVAISVVTYNRKVLLHECIRLLLDQEYKDFDILIIDNGSTDGTKDSLKEYLQQDNVLYYNTGKNLGGAGGFNFALKLAVKHEYEYVWMMDDDTYSDKMALQKLMEADKILQGKYGFLSSAVLWKDDTACIMNRQKIQEPWYMNLKYLSQGLLPVYMATFVSFFVRTDIVQKVGLPIKEFFIWGDDVEYSQRISKEYPCYLVGQSIVHHMTNNNEGSNIAKDAEERLERYAYAYRNEVYIARQNGIRGILYQLAKIALHCMRVLLSGKSKKTKKIALILKNSAKGIFFNPKVEYIVGKK